MDKIFSPIKSRIVQFIDNQKIEKKYFYEKTKISASNFKGSGASSELGGDKIVNILSSFPNLNPSWLLLGKGKMLTSDDEVSVNYSPVVAAGVEKYGDNACKFNVFDFATAAAAGEAILLNEIDKTKAQPNIFLPEIGPGTNIRVPVRGDSMHSTIKDGDKVVATLLQNPKDDIRSGYVYVIIDKEDGLLIKRLYKDGGNHVEVVSDNEIYKPYKRKLSDLQAVFKAKEVHTTDLRNYYDDVRRDVRDLQKAVKDLQSKFSG